MAEGGSSRPWDGLVGQIYLGGEAFRAQMEERAERRPAGREIPRSQRQPLRPSIEDVCVAVARTLVALLGRELRRERLSPIADALGVDLARISQLAATGRRLAVEDREFGQRLRAVEASLARK